MTRANAVKLMLGLLSAEVLSAFELSMLYAALKAMIADFGNPEAVGWVMTSFFLASAVSAAICGRLGDIFGRKRVLMVVIALSIVGSLIAAFSSTLEWVIVGRVVQGTAGAVFPLCIGLVRENVKAESAPIFIGILAATLTVTMGMGTFLGGVIVDNLSWHWVFFAGAAAGVVAFFTIGLWMPRSPGRPFDRRTNLVGGVLFAPGVVLVLLGISEAPHWGWTSVNTLLCLSGGAAFLAAWAASELRAAVPLLDVRLLAHRQVLLVNLGSAVLGLTAFQSMQLWSIVLQQPTATGVGLGLSATLAGVVLLPKTLIALASGPSAGWLISHYSGRVAMMAGAGIMLLGWVMLGFKHDSLWFIAPMLLLLGFGMSMFYSSIPIVIAQSVPLDRTSEASGMMLVIRSTAMGIGAQVVAYISDSSTIAVDGASYPDQTAVYRVIGYVVAGCVVMILIASRLSRARASAPVDHHGAAILTGK
ncbi:MAG: MFS transporter [Porticoccaceae bacterium]|jgi:MFS family permease|nr:MFS transporter [Porticoccaceae bacterium]MEA3299259.1 MFS transporter [Pseudomonadota bacterium]HLS97612.1 MFS transporter [Porticoccaceae bacterium]